MTWVAWRYTQKDWLKKMNWPLIFGTLRQYETGRHFTDNRRSGHLQRTARDRYQLQQLGLGQYHFQSLDQEQSKPAP
jgi:hypothetical protein